MNNKVSAEKKEAAIKTLAIIGFITAVVVCLWLAVQIVRLVPSAWTSLASLAESVYGTNESLTIATEEGIVNSGEAFRVTWTELRSQGAYIFSYRCTDGVSAETRTASGDIVALDCEEKLPLSSGTRSIEVIFTSEKKRFTDVPFSVSFIPRGKEDSAEDKNDLVTVVNASIAHSDSVATDDTDNDVESPDTDSVGGGATPAPSVPQTTSYFPVSNPQGYTDLRVTYLGIGTFNKTTGTFTPTVTIDNDVRSAVRFEVKNIGTKTSGTWTFDADLMGYDFESDAQTALRPNERAVITLGFDEITTETGSETIEVEVKGGSDTNPGNNDFSWSVKVVD